MNPFRYISLLALAWFAPWQTAQALTVSPSPSLSGSYTVSWSPSTDATRRNTELWEQVGDGEWRRLDSYAPAVTSASFGNKDSGVYRYKTRHCRSWNNRGARWFGGGWGWTSCQDAASPVSVEVRRLEISLRWDPATAEYEARSTLRWEATRARSCALDGAALTLDANGGGSGAVAHSDLVAPRTGTLRCTGLNGETKAATAALTVRPAPLFARPSISYDGNYTVRWGRPMECLTS